MDLKNIKTTLTGLFIAILLAVQPLVSDDVIDWTKPNIYVRLGIAAAVAIFAYFSKDNTTKI